MIDGREALAAARVLTVGGANAEHGYSLPHGLEPDTKVTIDPQPWLAGGSSVNHSCRLLAMGVDVDPVLPLAKADPVSAVVTAALAAAEKTGAATCRRTDLQVRGAGLTTPLTTIIRQGASRAVLNEFSPDLMTAYRAHVDRHLDRLARRRAPPSVVMVGHVHADREKASRGDVGYAGEITRRVLAHPRLAGVRRYVNFGSAQYRLGAKRWARVLRDDVDVFQLDIGEVRRFSRDADLADTSLESILGWFRERCTVIVTLERFGAIGQLAGSDRPIAAWPFLIEDLADTTGAGDAMGAGVVASMLLEDFHATDVDDDVRAERFERALEFGRVCGAFACTTVGGASDCPSLETLADFEHRARRPLSARDISRAVSRHDLFLIDRAFDS